MDNFMISRMILDRQVPLAKKTIHRLKTIYPQIGKSPGSGQGKVFFHITGDLKRLANAIERSNHGIFADYFLWKRAVRALPNFPQEFYAQSIRILQKFLVESLPEEAGNVADQFLVAAMDSLKRPVDNSVSYLNASAPNGLLAQNFLHALIRLDRIQARRVVTEAAEDGTPIRDVYLDVLQTALYEIGRLWQINRVTVAQEHFASVMVRSIMAQLNSRIISAGKNGLRIVGLCVSKEQHDLGIQMVTDFFEMAGWETYSLGANTPTEDLLRSMEMINPHLMAISVTMFWNVDCAVELIEKIKKENPTLPIMIGGRPFNQKPNLWEQVGADGYAPDAEIAVKFAQRMIH